MTRYFCDRCEFEINNSNVVGAKVTPGIVGDKLLCRSCWEKWAEIVNRFFQKQGQ